MPRPLIRSLQIVLAAIALAWAWLRLRRKAPQELPERLCATLERLGTTFVKLGQGLSHRRDVVPLAYRQSLERLHSQVPPFASDIAVRTIETALGEPIASLFAEFEPQPFAAASVAQVHRARLHDGREVVVKVRRPGVLEQVRTDLGLLRLLVRTVQALVPALARYQPQELIDELGTQLLIEIDLEHEARNMRRLEPVFASVEGVTMPRVIEPYATRDVLVQEFSHGEPLQRVFGSPRGVPIAGRLLDAYLHQVFVAGVFHGDPHPGNLFLMQDGRLCFHDFGTVGYLDPAARQALGGFVDAIAYSDAEGALDAAMAMGFLRPPLDRREYIRAISEILDEVAAAPISDWSLAETIWRIARLGHGRSFRLPRHLLVLVRTLFLAENDIRALNPDFDLLAELEQRRDALAQALAQAERATRRRPLAQRLARTASALPALLADFLREAQSDEGRPSLSLHHRGLEEMELHIARTGNRLSLALVILGLYLAGSLLMLHSAGPRIWGDVPLLAVVAYVIAALLSVRLVFAVIRSGHL